MFRIPFKLHWHDYEMEFHNPAMPFEWVFVCKCGDRVYDQETAIRRMRWPILLKSR